MYYCYWLNVIQENEKHGDFNSRGVNTSSHQLNIFVNWYNKCEYEYEYEFRMKVIEVSSLTNIKKSSNVP